MTTTMTPVMTTTMTTNEEEKLILNSLLSARHATELAKQAKRELDFKIKEHERYEQSCEQAFIDYMKANGVKSTQVSAYHMVTLGTSTAIDVPDVDAVPADYIREKITREPNKALICELHKAGKLEGANWYSVKVSDKLTVTVRG